jgi:hypothetical protein
LVAENLKSFSMAGAAVRRQRRCSHRTTLLPSLLLGPGVGRPPAKPARWRIQPRPPAWLQYSRERRRVDPKRGDEPPPRIRQARSYLTCREALRSTAGLGDGGEQTCGPGRRHGGGTMHGILHSRGGRSLQERHQRGGVGPLIQPSRGVLAAPLRHGVRQPGRLALNDTRSTWRSIKSRSTSIGSPASKVRHYRPELPTRGWHALALPASCLRF